MSSLPNFLELLPAYGRDYKSATAAKNDFLAGRDFILAGFEYGGRYCSIRDFSAGQAVLLRYAQARKVAPAKVP